MKKLLPQNAKNPQGFTLIELMIVVVIIAVLAVIGVTVYSNIQKNARDSRRRADIESISKALEAHVNQSANQYCTGAAGSYCFPAASWFAGGAIPADPNGSAYSGLPVSGATTYNVCATLENPSGSTYCLSNQQ